jgi:hypothetical protein
VHTHEPAGRCRRAYDFLGVRGRNIENDLSFLHQRVHTIRIFYFIRLSGGVSYLPPEPPASVSTFFDEAADWQWSVETDLWHKLEVPRKARTLNPLFSSEEIITRDKWNATKAAIESEEPIDGFRLELKRIRSRLHWGARKLATLEAAIMIETILRDRCWKELSRRGFSETKTKGP